MFTYRKELTPFMQRKKGSILLYQTFAFLMVEVTGLEPAISSSRTMRDTTFATPRCGKNIRFFCKWSNMWSDRRFNDFSTFGRAEKVSVFKGFRLFSKNLRRARWLSPETGAIPPSLRLDLWKNYWILLWSAMWSKPHFREICVRLKVRKV